MSATPDSTFTDPEQRVADLERQLAERDAELAERTAERDEALEQQTAITEMLQVINVSPGDLAPVFDAMLEKAIRLCEAAFGGLWTYDGEVFNSVAIRNVPAELVDFVRRPYSAGPTTPLGRVARTMGIVSISDLATDEASRSGDETDRQWLAGPIELGGARSYLAVPLLKDDALIGAFALSRREIRPFSDKQIALVQSFAQQAVIAMENARLITETREALEQQTATAEVLGVINSSPGDLTPVFDAILEKAHTLCNASSGSLALIEDNGYRPIAIHGEAAFRDAWFSQGWLPFSTEEGAARLKRGEVLHILDAANYAWEEDTRRLLELDSVRSLLIVPLLKDGVLFGMITAFRREIQPFTDKQIALLQNFAAQAVIAMENARLLTETREALEQQTATADVLGVINASPGDLPPVFDAMLEKAMRLCEAAFGSLWTLRGDSFQPAAHRGVPAAYADYLGKEVPTAGSGTGRARLLTGEPFAHIADLADEEPYRAGEPHRLALVDLGKARTALLVPLRKDEAVIGFIMIYRQEVRPFTEKQIALLQNFAAQAVIAMENARLLGELRKRTEEVAELNRGLEARVAEQVDELGRVGRLKRFLAPQLAELIVSHGDEKILESHRREIVVVFCDLRGYTAFTETAEPEEVLEFLRQYHGALGPLVTEYEGTLDQFSGDGIMVFFNDPVPCPDPAERAVKMAVAMREAAGKLIADWSRHGCELGFGAGIAQGYATLGQIGFSDRSGYTAIGTVCNLAARLCAEAKDGQILVSSRIAEAVSAIAKLEDLGNLELRGLRRPVAAFNVAQSTNAADTRPNLTVVATEPGA